MPKGTPSLDLQNKYGNKMDKEEIEQLELNQAFHKANLLLKWLTEDMRNLNEAVNKATLYLKYFSKTYEQINK